MSGERPVASDSARSTSSCSRRTCASISSERSETSGSGLISARQVALVGLQELGARARDALDEHAHAALALGHLPDDRHGADPVQVVGARLVGVVLLQQQQDHAVAGQRPVDRLDRQRPADAERRHRHRQHDRAAQRHDRQFDGSGGVCGVSAINYTPRRPCPDDTCSDRSCSRQLPTKLVRWKLEVGS